MFFSFRFSKFFLAIEYLFKLISIVWIFEFCSKFFARNNVEKPFEVPISNICFGFFIIIKFSKKMPCCQEMFQYLFLFFSFCFSSSNNFFLICFCISIFFKFYNFFLICFCIFVIWKMLFCFVLFFKIFLNFNYLKNLIFYVFVF